VNLTKTEAEVVAREYAARTSSCFKHFVLFLLAADVECRFAALLALLFQYHFALETADDERQIKLHHGAVALTRTSLRLRQPRSRIRPRLA
jgi:hypothetical protein